MLLEILKFRAYLKDGIIEVETNSKNKNVRDICTVVKVFKKLYQPRNSLEADENDDLLADSQSMLNRGKNYFGQPLITREVNDVRQIYTVEPLAPQPNSFEVQIAINSQILIKFQQN
jgi:hypothetical protein